MMHCPEEKAMVDEEDRERIRSTGIEQHHTDFMRLEQTFNVRPS